ncbi:hypothetical protein BJV78DRAFT_1285227 [Lactifluus subvellereus]|nr:hypothetical protein BJV78DRAFT_1285227 [Lactifluus subvellereus]
MSPSATPSQRLRIAIPPEQSIPGQLYTLELKHHFCCAATRSTSEESDAWRRRALELETELHAARAAASSERVELAALKSALALAGDQTKPSTTKKKGKQAKKGPASSEARRPQALEVPSAESTAGLKDIVPSGSKLSRSLPRANSTLFSSLHALDVASAVAAIKPTSPPNAALVVAATFRCIDALQALLVRAISPPASDAPEGPTSQEALNGIACALPHVLRIAVRALQRACIDSSNAARLEWQHADPIERDPIHPLAHDDTTSALDLVLGRVATRLLVPAVRALAPCTFAKTERILLRSPTNKGGFADGADLFSLVGAALDALPDPDPQHIAVHDRVALEAVRALTSLIVDRPSHDRLAQPTPAQRIHRIARKDALHFLCDTALLAFRRSAPGSVAPGGPEEVLRVALAEALGKLALTQSVREGGSGLDVVEEHRVMVVLERAWSVGLRVGHIFGDTRDAEMAVSQDDVREQDEDVAMMDGDGED